MRGSIKLSLGETIASQVLDWEKGEGNKSSQLSWSFGCVPRTAKRTGSWKN